MSLILCLLLALGDPASDDTPTYLYKILTSASWEAGRESDRLALGPDDEAFIHLAQAHQVERIANKFFSEHTEVVVVQLRTDQLVGRLVKESNPGGTVKYYHLYDGFLPMKAVESHRLLLIAHSHSE